MQVDNWSLGTAEITHQPTDKSPSSPIPADGAIDTLVVNIECLASDGIRSLEVAYYEDLLGFPPEDSTAAAPPYPAKGAAAPLSASKGPRRTSPFRPPPSSGPAPPAVPAPWSHTV